MINVLKLKMFEYLLMSKMHPCRAEIKSFYGGFEIILFAYQQRGRKNHPQSPYFGENVKANSCKYQQNVVFEFLSDFSFLSFASCLARVVALGPPW